jgi:hypothetical protein
MDPDACLRRLLHAICDEDLRETAAAIRDLAEWLQRGGALPLAKEPHKMMVRLLLEVMT